VKLLSTQVKGYQEREYAYRHDWSKPTQPLVLPELVLFPRVKSMYLCPKEAGVHMDSNRLPSFDRMGRLILLFFFLISILAYAEEQTEPDHPKVRVHFIAADEVEWDYAPLGQDEAMGHPLDDFQSGLMEPGPHGIGRIYKKCIYREYTDAKFNRLMTRGPEEQYLGIVGPVLYAEVGDTLKIVFKNNASRPYSMHPHGVFYQKDSEGSGYNDGTSGKDKDDDSVPPGGSHIYIWELPERAGPGPADPSSVVWLYHSHVEEMRDVASGLFGAIVVTARGKARTDGHPVDVDREFVSMMISINEKQSWYFDENMKKSVTETLGADKHRAVHSADSSSMPGQTNPNIRHTINGYMFGNMPMMTMQKGQRVRWYLLTLGDSNNFHTPHWHGNSVTFRGHHTDVIALSPAQMETADMVPDNPGIWLFHCHISDHMMGGMMTRYQVLP
jgi:FtsP/CotA-like multicopper oxidase with cupredoxin domain